MRRLIAIVVCALEGVAYAMISVFLGWKNGGGIVPLMILFAVWAATWAVITHKADASSNAD